jgi:hypothetical protein
MTRESKSNERARRDVIGSRYELFGNKFIEDEVQYLQRGESTPYAGN